MEKNPPKWMKQPPQRPAYVDNALSETFWSKFESEYQRWRERAAELSGRLAELGRPTLLVESQRSAVKAIVAEADGLARQVDHYGLFLSSRTETAARMALATLLLDYPEVAVYCRDEFLAAHPSSRPETSHRMLGPPHDVQGETMDRSDRDHTAANEQILLLQLGSDELGPRMMWWDAGNLTFWISRADAAARRFDMARAEIEGR